MKYVLVVYDLETRKVRFLEFTHVRARITSRVLSSCNALPIAMISAREWCAKREPLWLAGCRGFCSVTLAVLFIAISSLPY